MKKYLLIGIVLLSSSAFASETESNLHNSISCLVKTGDSINTKEGNKELIKKNNG